jgi:hypothetical protein
MDLPVTPVSIPDQDAAYLFWKPNRIAPLHSGGYPFIDFANMRYSARFHISQQINPGHTPLRIAPVGLE